MDKPLVNRVANSGLITLKLEEFYPEHEMVKFDLKDYLYMELVLKEKDFRQQIVEHDWSQYQDKVVLIGCSSDAIIPTWAYMLVSIEAARYAEDTYVGDQEAYLAQYYDRSIRDLDLSQYEDQRIVIKGCSDHPVPPHAYQALARRLTPIAKSIMYGEPCSTVPLYKRK